MIILGVLRTWLQGAGQFAVCVKIITGFWWNYVSCFLTNEMFCCHNNKNLAEKGWLSVITDCLSTMNVKFVWKTLSSSFLSVKFCLSDDDTSMKRITNKDLSCRNTSQKCPKNYDYRDFKSGKLLTKPRISRILFSQCFPLEAWNEPEN